ncbi:hypothetical protein [Novosphingobium sp. 9U]|uniref:hypothetical protein n=1 Tax=Novosphingobium sp. 9U TaxID=2653158 RepID=UPI0012F01316|nr:hypothetical protein [Novosphingobium sp. 9U]VWX54547.1 hypothetical protein NOVOSPHI9U_640002 [Novosphingobium sp. 9U]
MLIPSNTTLFALLVGSGVVAALITQIATFLLSKLQRTRQGRYIALRSALAIEEFGSDCLVVIYEIEGYEEDESWGKQHVTLPRLTSFPEDDEGWRALPPTLAHRLLSFAPKIRNEQRNIDFYWQNTEPDDATTACSKAALALGCDADLLGRDIRQEMKLPSRDAAWNWGRRLQDLRQKSYRDEE